MSFESYVTAKSSEKSEKQASEFRTKKKAPKENDNMEVTINIGLKRFDDEDLKTVRGKHLPIAVPANATYATILEKAKWKAFDRRFETAKEYVLVFEDGTHALFMPGSCFKVITPVGGGTCSILIVIMPKKYVLRNQEKKTIFDY